MNMRVIGILAILAAIGHLSGVLWHLHGLIVHAELFLGLLSFGVLCLGGLNQKQYRSIQDTTKQILLSVSKQTAAIASKSETKTSNRLTLIERVKNVAPILMLVALSSITPAHAQYVSNYSAINKLDLTSDQYSRIVELEYQLSQDERPIVLAMHHAKRQLSAALEIQQFEIARSKQAEYLDCLNRLKQLRASYRAAIDSLLTQEQNETIHPKLKRDRMKENQVNRILGQVGIPRQYYLH